MEEIIIYAPAKINLSLDILFKREDGYHQIESIMQEISLKDKLIFKNRDKGIVIESNNPHIPLDFHNLVYKVWEKINLYTKEERGLYIYIEKNIPVSAGLAGGSSNAAATFKALNTLWKLDLAREDLMQLAEGLGADIPFCIMGGTALARGIGSDLKPIKSLKDINILICNPGFPISAKYAYNLLDLKEERIDTKKLIKAIENKNIEDLAKEIKNKMEKPIIKKYPVIGEIKNTMLASGALGALMSGSGPTVFGIFKDSQSLEKAKSILQARFPKTYTTKSI